MSILHRSAISIVANIAKGGLSFVTGMLLARGLGPEQYGTFAFLLASFTALRSLLDLGTSSAFFTFISKKERTKIFFSYYFLWLLIQFSTSIIFIALLAPDEWINTIWLGESRGLVLISFVAVFLQQQIWNMVAQVGESQRLTFKVQMINVSIAFMHVVFVVALLWTDNLSVERVYYIIILEFTLAAIVAYLVYPLKFSAGHESLRVVSLEYWTYCLPLIPYSILGVMSGLADTWLLQYYGGAVEQAYFSVALQFSTISMLATISVLRILWKEVAEANAKGDMDKLKLIYVHTNHMLFMFGAVVSCFCIPWVPEVISLLLGDEYVGGSLTVSLMLLVPPFLALSQVNGTMFYALELIKPYVIISMVQHLLMIVATYLFLAPNDAIIPGLGLASTGLALSTLLMSFVNVNFSIWWLSRNRGWPYSIGYQLMGIGLFLFLGMLVYNTINTMFDDTIHLLIRAGIAGVLYIVLVGVVLYCKPSLMGLNRSKLGQYLGRIMSFTTTKDTQP